jgi:hypothetical protein
MTAQLSDEVQMHFAHLLQQRAFLKSPDASSVGVEDSGSARNGLAAGAVEAEQRTHVTSHCAVADATWSAGR